MYIFRFFRDGDFSNGSNHLAKTRNDSCVSCRGGHHIAHLELALLLSAQLEWVVHAADDIVICYLPCTKSDHDRLTLRSPSTAKLLQRIVKEVLAAMHVFQVQESLVLSSFSYCSSLPAQSIAWHSLSNQDLHLDDRKELRNRSLYHVTFFHETMYMDIIKYGLQASSRFFNILLKSFASDLFPS